MMKMIVKLGSVRVPETGTLTAGEWTYIRIPLTNARDLREITLVKIDGFSNTTGVLWLNGFWALNVDSIEWQEVDNWQWEVDRQTRELLVQFPYPERYSGAGSYGGGLGAGFFGGNLGTGYVTYDNPMGSVLRIVGGRDPFDLESDDSDTVVPDAFITTKATQLAFGSEGGGPQTDLDRQREQALAWDRRAEREKRSFPALINVRRVR